jgi:hypothetical protein
MGFMASNAGGDFKQVPPGAYIGRCYSIIDLGTQISEKFATSAHKIMLQWELFGDDEDGQPLTVTRDGKTMPMTVRKEYTVSLNEKANLRKDLAAWRGKDFTSEEAKAFDVSKLLGAYCMVNVTTSEGSNGKTYSNVAGLTPLPSALKANKPAGVHPLIQFDLDHPDMEIMDGFHDKLQERIRATPEWNKSSKKQQPAMAGGDDMDDDVPF